MFFSPASILPDSRASLEHGRSAPVSQQENRETVLEGFAPLMATPEIFGPGLAHERPRQRRPESPEFQWLLDKIESLVRAHPGISPEQVWIRWRRREGGSEILLSLEIQRPEQGPWRYRARVRSSRRERLVRKLRLTAQDFRRRLLDAIPMEAPRLACVLA